MADSEWTITLGDKKGWGGFCPSYYDNDYPQYANKNQASDIVVADLTDPNVLTQGPGTADLTGGDQTGELGSVLISSILKHSVSSDTTYACGEDKVFKITSSAVSNGDFPLSITGGTYQVADDLVYYQGDVYVFWNDTGTEGEIAKIDISAPSINVDWGSTIPTNAAHLEDASHYAINGGDDVVYFTNGRYVGTIEDTTLTVQGLDFWKNCETASLTWNHNRVIIAVNRPNLSGANFNQSAIYTWNGVSSSWEGDPIEVSGEIGALYTKNGVTYVWWKDGTSTGGYSFGYITGNRVEELERYEGSLPNQTQVCEHDGYIAWVTDNKIYKWGAKDPDDTAKMFHYMNGAQATIGAIATPFGDLLVSSYSGSNYSLAKNSGYSTSARYKTVAFPVSGANFQSVIDDIIVEFDKLASGAKVDFTLTYNKGESTKSGTQIAYSDTDDSTRRTILNGSKILEDFRLDISSENGSTSNPVKLRSIFIKGHYVNSK